MRIPLNTPSLSRRSMVITGVTAAVAASAQDRKDPITAGQIVERIKANIGISWREQTVDKIIVGSPDTPIKGIATTMMATLDVIERAASSGKNMVITHEPTFYSHQDTIDQLKDDATYQYKLDFCRKHDIVSFHFHDHWHGQRPDGIATGMARDLGWEKSADPNNNRLFSFPSPIPLARLAKEMQTRLKIRTIRVVGDPKLPVKQALASWGYISQFPGIPLFARPDIDVFIVGETREWELVEYAQDAIRSGKRKGLIIVGHVVSEQAGMKYCADWLRAFVPEVPIEFIAAPEPFWNPDNPVG
jgi:putative NIF3 family GTP cyclohydrolase 1 type 2